jgi:hypothetical protein
MGIAIDWTYLIGAAVAVVGIIEWAKNFPGMKATLLWWCLLPIASFAVAYFGDGGIWQILTNGCVVWAVAQLGYTGLVKLPEALIEKLKN